MYYWARMMDVKVYAIVTYNPYTGYYVLDIYSVPILVHDGMLYELPNELADEVNIVSGDVLDFEIPFDNLPDMLYTVEYNANNGSGETMKSVHELGRTSQLLTNTFTKTGYTFVGWSTAADGKTAIYADQASIRNIAAAGETVTLYAIWGENSYTVQYNGNKPTHASSTLLDIPGATECKYDSTVTLGDAPKLAGYTFGGWYLDPSCNVKVGDAETVKEKANLTSECDGTVTLYAKWTANTYTVTYDANGGSVDTKNQSKIYDSTYGSLPTPTRADYLFIGWYIGSTKVETSTMVATAGNHTLKAEWVRTTDYVNFGDGKTDRHYIHWKSSGSNKGRTDGKDTIIPSNLNIGILKSLGYTKMKVSMTFWYRVDDWGDQLIQIHSNTDAEITRFEYEWKECGWTQTTIEFEVPFSQTDGFGGFWIEWDLFDDGTGSDTWFVGGTTLTLTAIK